MIIKLFISVLILTSTFSSQATYIIAAICKDGIVVGADSRIAFLDKEGKIQACFDSSQKIFRFQDIVLAMAGTYSFDHSISFMALLERFSEVNEEKIDIDKFHDIFLRFSKTQISSEAFVELCNNQFFICGYSKGVPQIKWYHKNVDTTLSSGYFTSIRRDNYQVKTFEWLKQAEVDRTTFYIQNEMQRTLDRRNQINVYHSGGPASIINITSGNIAWVHKQSKNNFESIQDFQVALKQGLIKMWYRSKEDSVRFRNMFLK